jgi:hypothetical protein
MGSTFFALFCAPDLSAVAAAIGKRPPKEAEAELPARGSSGSMAWNSAQADRVRRPQTVLSTQERQLRKMASPAGGWLRMSQYQGLLPFSVTIYDCFVSGVAGELIPDFHGTLRRCRFGGKVAVFPGRGIGCAFSQRADEIGGSGAAGRWINRRDTVDHRKDFVRPRRHREVKEKDTGKATLQALRDYFSIRQKDGLGSMDPDDG